MSEARRQGDPPQRRQAADGQPQLPDELPVRREDPQHRTGEGPDLFVDQTVEGIVRSLAERPRSAEPIAFVEDPRRFEQDDVGGEARFRAANSKASVPISSIGRISSRAKSKLPRSQRKTCSTAQLQLQLDDALEHLAAQQSLVDQQPAERAPRCRGRLPRHGGIERRGVEVPALDEQLAQARRPGSPGRDERSFVEAEAGLLAVALELERPGALAQMDELQDIADRDVLEAARDRHRPPTLYPG